MKRFDKGYVYSCLLSDLLSCFVLTFMFADDILLENTEELVINVSVVPYFAVLFAILYAGFILYRVLYYRSSGYGLTEREIVCKRGVFFKKNSVLEYRKIHAINKKQTIFHRIFKIAILTVDSGSANTSQQAEITIVERQDVVDDLLKQLHALREGGAVDAPQQEEKVLLSKDDRLYSFTSKKKVLYALISVASTAITTGALGLLLGVIIGICYGFLQANVLDTMGMYVVAAVLITAGAMLLLSLISFIGCLIRSFVGYHNFSITKRDNDLVIAYGLLERHTNTFSYDRIKGIKICQGFFQRLLGFASIKLEVIGYTNEAGEDNVELGVLVPFCNFKEIPEILKRVLPDYIPQEKQTKAVAYFPFVSWFMLILAIVIGTVMLSAYILMALLGAPAGVVSIVLLGLLALGLVILAIGALNGYLNFRNSGVGYSDKKITAYSGGFTRVITVFQTKNLVAVQRVTTPLRQKAGIASLILHMRTNALSNEVEVLMQEDALGEKLEELLIL